MKKKDTSYLEIFKSTSLFGGIQLFTIIISIVRSKFVAVLLGPSGMGLNGLLSSTVSLIIAFSNLGVSRSVVKNIASTDKERFSKISNVVGSLMILTWTTSVISALLTFVFSKFLSEITFGTQQYSFAFKWIAISIFLNQIATSYESVLRGMHKVKLLASATLGGSLSGLFVSIPIYYFYGIQGIVPSIVASSIIIYLINYFYYRKVNIQPDFSNRDELILEGKDILKMGIVLSISSVFILAEAYYVRIFIRTYGTLEHVGFFNAGIAIVNTYFGLFFASITMDYYPKLAAVASENFKAIKLMVEQSEMTVLIISPFLVIFIIFIKPIIILLYSDEFIPLIELVLWASVGIFFKAASYALGVIFISKGDVKTLFWSELISTLVLFILNLIGYYYYGLEGLGISFMISNIYVYLQNYVLVRYKYSFKYSNNFIIVFSVVLFFGLLSLLCAKTLIYPYNYLFGIIVILITSGYSFIQINKRMDLIIIIKSFLNKNN